MSRTTGERSEHENLEAADEVEHFFESSTPPDSFFCSGGLPSSEPPAPSGGDGGGVGAVGGDDDGPAPPSPKRTESFPRCFAERPSPEDLVGESGDEVDDVAKAADLFGVADGAPGASTVEPSSRSSLFFSEITARASLGTPIDAAAPADAAAGAARGDAGVRAAEGRRRRPTRRAPLPGRLESSCASARRGRRRSAQC